jgi:uncharacterized protein
VNCPRCNTLMTEMERHNVLIDVCDNCGGVWLDKGELAKIITHMKETESSINAELRAAGERERYVQNQPPYRYEHDDHRRDHDRDHGNHGYNEHNDHGYDHGNRKKSGFQRLFDIFD